MTVQEIINSAMVADNAKFRDALIWQAEAHDNYAALSRNPRAIAGAESQRSACLRAYDHAGFFALNDICDDLNTCVVALNVAAKLQGITPRIIAQALEQWHETKRQRGEWMGAN